MKIYSCVEKASTLGYSSLYHICFILGGTVVDIIFFYAQLKMPDSTCWRVVLICLLIQINKTSRILQTSWEGHKLSNRSGGFRFINNSTSKRSLLRCVEQCLRTFPCEAVIYGRGDRKGSCSFLEVSSSIQTLTTPPKYVLNNLKVPSPSSCRIYKPRDGGRAQNGSGLFEPGSVTSDPPSTSVVTMAMSTELFSTKLTQSELSTSAGKHGFRTSTIRMAASTTNLAPATATPTNAISTLTKLKTTPDTTPTTKTTLSATKTQRILKFNCKCTFPGKKSHRREQQVVMTLRKHGKKRPVYCLYERNYEYRFSKIGLRLSGIIPHITVDSKMCRVCWNYVNTKRHTSAIKCACSGGDQKQTIKELKSGTTLRCMTFDSPSQLFFLLTEQKDGLLLTTMSNVGDDEKTLKKINIPLRFVGFHLDQLDRKLYFLGKESSQRDREDMFELRINDLSYKFKKITTFRRSKTDVFNIAPGEKTILRVMEKNKFHKTIIYRDLRAGTTKVMCDHPDTELAARYITYWRHQVFIVLQASSEIMGLVCSIRNKDSTTVSLPFRAKYEVTLG